jgi:hypothetical protein
MSLNTRIADKQDIRTLTTFRVTTQHIRACRRRG